MKKRAALLICAAMLTVLASCAKHGEMSGENKNTESAVNALTDDTPDAAYVNETEAPLNYQLSEFDDAFIEYLCLNGYDSSNFLVSPASFRASLCLAAVGAQGSTRTEILRAAGFSGMDKLDAWYAGLNDSVVGSVWGDEELFGEFTDSYVSNINANYQADAYSCKTDELTQAIKDWISQKTDGMPSAAQYDVSGASSVLVSALHMQTAWKNPFTDAAIQQGVFVGKDGNAKNMDFMEQSGEYLYAEENGVKVLAIPMENAMHFVCFTGNQTGKFDKITSLHPEKVRVVLPKFELASVFDARDLTGFLLERGVNEALDSQTANYYNMCSSGDWFLQEMIQTVWISADEKGIAASSEAGEAAGTAESDERIEMKEFIADSPFSFAVFSDFGTSNQHMLLYGQMMNGN